MNETRKETDSIGSINVSNERLWGAQTQRSLMNFNIGDEKMPAEIIQAYAWIKKSAAQIHFNHDRLDELQFQLIDTACDAILNGEHDKEFPLHVWQTGSGTQTHMNVNEVIANLAAQLASEPLGKKQPVHPNDHVNLGQSSNDTFPTALNIATAFSVSERLLPALSKLRNELHIFVKKHENTIKIGRTHLQDAVPLTVGQAFSAFVDGLDDAQRDIDEALSACYRLAIGGTAVGTGLNAPHDFDREMTDRISELTHLPFEPARNKFAALSTQHAAAKLSHALNTLAGLLMKLANDIRWLASGPRCGLGELMLPMNEPGSSIMPGKVNPTQCEALTMIALQVMGNDTTVSMAASQGNFELNVFKPLIAYNVLQSIRLLSDGMNSFSDHCIQGLEVHTENTNNHLHHSLMLVTALTPHIGYDQAAKVAKHAHAKGTSIKEACLELKVLTESEYEKWMNIEAMIEPQH